MHPVHRALDGHGDPVVQRDVAHQAVVFAHCGASRIGQEAVGAFLRQRCGAFGYCLGAPKGLGVFALAAHLALLKDFDNHDVPAAHAHDHQQQQNHFGHQV